MAVRGSDLCAMPAESETGFQVRPRDERDIAVIGRAHFRHEPRSLCPLLGPFIQGIRVNALYLRPFLIRFGYRRQLEHLRKCLGYFIESDHQISISPAVGTHELHRSRFLYPESAVFTAARTNFPPGGLAIEVQPQGASGPGSLRISRTAKAAAPTARRTPTMRRPR